MHCLEVVLIWLPIFGDWLEASGWIAFLHNRVMWPCQSEKVIVVQNRCRKQKEHREMSKTVNFEATGVYVRDDGFNVKKCQQDLYGKKLLDGKSSI